MSTDPRAPDQIQLAAEVPPHLREPPTYPQAQSMLRMVQDLLQGPLDVIEGQLTIRRIFPGEVSLASVLIHWRERPVLVAPWGGPVWLYYPGPWEAILGDYARDAQLLAEP